MRNDERFEIERAFDLLPHVVGASWACIWFRLNGIKKPSVEEFRSKTLEYFLLLKKYEDVFPTGDKFSEINSYIKYRLADETEKIIQGKNPEIEKRYKRYIDYG